MKSGWKSAWFLLTLIAGSLSLANLAVKSFEIGLVPVLRMALDYYETLMTGVFGPMEPYLNEALSAISRLLTWDVHLYPHWKHAFVLILLCFTQTVRQAYAEGRPGTAAINAIGGVVMAILGGVAAGTVPLQGSDDLNANIMIVAIPIAVLTLAWVVGSFWNAYSHRRNNLTWSGQVGWNLFYAGLFLISSLVIVSIGLSLPFVRAMPNPGLALLASIVVCLSLWWIGVAIAHATRAALAGRSFLETFRGEGTWYIGASILGLFLGAGAFLLANAGLQI